MPGKTHYDSVGCLGTFFFLFPSCGIVTTKQGCQREPSKLLLESTSVKGDRQTAIRSRSSILSRKNCRCTGFILSPWRNVPKRVIISTYFYSQKQWKFAQMSLLCLQWIVDRRIVDVSPSNMIVTLTISRWRETFSTISVRCLTFVRWNNLSREIRCFETIEHDKSSTYDEWTDQTLIHTHDCRIITHSVVIVRSREKSD